MISTVFLPVYRSDHSQEADENTVSSVFCSVVITFITIASALRRAEMSTVARCKGILSIEIVRQFPSSHASM